jgi:hypothetical protein
MTMAGGGAWRTLKVKERTQLQPREKIYLETSSIN